MNIEEFKKIFKEKLEEIGCKDVEPDSVGDMFKRFLKGAKKIRTVINEGYFGHALTCNYQSNVVRGNGHGRCNCGISDILSTLEDYEKLLEDLVEK